jgi:hypothetical protein
MRYNRLSSSYNIQQYLNIYGEQMYNGFRDLCTYLSQELEEQTRSEKKP